MICVYCGAVLMHKPKCPALTQKMESDGDGR